MKLSFVHVKARLRVVETVIDELCDENDHINTPITHCVAIFYNTINLKETVKPTIHDLSEKRDSSGLFVEGPVSYSEDLIEYHAHFTVRGQQ